MKKGYLYLLIGLLAFASCKDDDDSSESGSFVPGDACFSDTLFREMEHAGTIKASIRLSAPAPADYNLEVIIFCLLPGFRLNKEKRRLMQRLP